MLKDECYVEYGIKYIDYSNEESIQFKNGMLILTPIQMERAECSGPY